MKPTVTGRMMRARSQPIGWLGLALILPFLSSCDVNPDYLRKDIQERRLEEAGVEQVDPSGSSPEAGLSILRNFRVPALDRRRIGADTTSAGFHRYVHRCGTCHEPPDPELRTAAQWRNVFPRMEKHMEEAGLIPLEWSDRDLILRFLSRHAASEH